MLDWDDSFSLSVAWKVGSTGLLALCDLQTFGLEDLELAGQEDPVELSLSAETDDILGTEKAKKPLNLLILAALFLKRFDVSPILVWPGTSYMTCVVDYMSCKYGQFVKIKFGFKMSAALGHEVTRE